MIKYIYILLDLDILNKLMLDVYVNKTIKGFISLIYNILVNIIYGYKYILHIINNNITYAPLILYFIMLIYNVLYIVIQLINQ